MSQAFVTDPGYLQPQHAAGHAGATAPPQNNYTHYGVSNILPSQVSAPEPIYGMEAQQMLASQKPRQMSQMSQVGPASSHYGSPYQSPPVNVAYQQQDPATAQQQPPPSRKRSFQDEYDHYSAYSGLPHLPPGSREFTPYSQQQMQQAAASFQYPPPYPPQQTSSRPSPQPSHSSQSMRSSSINITHQQQQQSQVHHHHRLPNQQPPAKLARWDLSPTSYDEDDHGPPSVVGQPGMPAPAPRPKGPKLKFTPEDDSLLVELKETKNLTWKQIADFFPGRSSGTLQVRYCTKLKAKRVVWGDDMITKLRTAMHEYDQDRWRIIASKVGNGFSAAACKEKSMELEGLIPPAPQEGDESIMTEEGLEDNSYVYDTSTTTNNPTKTDMNTTTTTDEKQQFHQQQHEPRLYRHHHPPPGEE